MSKSVKSYASGSSRKQKAAKEIQNAQIKQRIKDILYSVKEQRQHIQNRLYQNQLQIQQLKQQYQLLRYQSDFDNLNSEQEIIITQLAQGLKEMGIDPFQILGKCSAIKQTEDFKGRKFTKQEIIKVQELLLARLQNEILEK